MEFIATCHAPQTAHFLTIYQQNSILPDSFCHTSAQLANYLRWIVDKCSYSATGHLLSCLYVYSSTPFDKFRDKLAVTNFIRFEIWWIIQSWW